jgi:hypothetical protein
MVKKIDFNPNNINKNKKTIIRLKVNPDEYFKSYTGSLTI